MQYIEITPLDPLFFRNGSPFTMGDETTATGMFPPNPSVLYGALRATFFSKENISLDNIRKETERLQIECIYFSKKEDKGSFLIHLPSDICKVQRRDKKENCIINQLVSFQSYPIRNDNKKYLKLKNEDDNEDDVYEMIEDSFLDAKYYLKKYITGKLKNEFSVSGLNSFDSYSQKEPKIGIGREDSSHGVDEGRLYRTDFVRWETNTKNSKLSVIVGISGLEIPEESGYLKLGGEARIASYKIVKSPFDWNANKPKLNGQYFKLVLLTPTIIQDNIFNNHLKPVCQLVGKPLNIGGFDMRERKPKPMRKAYPAGSVFFFETTGLSEEGKFELIEKYHGKVNLCNKEDSKQGYGFSFLADIAEESNGK